MSWTLSNKGKATHKEVLAQWVSMSLRKATRKSKVRKGFATTNYQDLALESISHGWANESK